METQIISDPGQDTIFRQLEQYDWEKDREFQGGLSAILGPSPSPSQLQELTLRAQCFYFSRKKGVSIDFDAYKAHLSRSKSSSLQNEQQPSSSPYQDTPQDPSPLNQTTNQESESRTPLPWQTQTSDVASKATLATLPQTPAFQPTPNPAHAPYPATFNEIVALIQAGEPVPGIEDIDPTVAWGKGSKPGRRAQRKPWEKALSEDQIQPGSRGGTFADDRDKFIMQELPDGEEHEFKGANWWKIVEEREQQGSAKGKDVTID